MRKVIPLLDNHKLIITNDENAESPNEYQNEEMFLVYEHRQFDVRRQRFNPRDIYEYLRELQKDTNSQDMKSVEDFSTYFIYTVYAYIHSGVSLSLTHGGDRFDTSSTGFILINREFASNDEEAQSLATGLLKEWNTYLSGDVYRYELYKIFPYKKYYLGIVEEEDRDTETYYDDKIIDDCGGYTCDKFSEILQDIDKELWNEETITLIDQ